MSGVIWTAFMDHPPGDYDDGDELEPLLSAAGHQIDIDPDNLDPVALEAAAAATWESVREDEAESWGHLTDYQQQDEFRAMIAVTIRAFLEAAAKGAK